MGILSTKSMKMPSQSETDLTEGSVRHGPLGPVSAPNTAVTLEPLRWGTSTRTTLSALPRVKGGFVRRIAYLVVSLCALAALVAPTAVAAQRMWIGFHDDASFRGAADRAERVQASANLGASMMRLYVQWEVAAPTRPTNPTDPLDPAYNLADVDEAVRNAQASGLQVMITLSGTPRWANGGKRANTMPTRLSDFRDFARAMASRYSGKQTDLPFVRFWTIWNEPNLQTFLSPQFKGRKSIAPANYAKLAAAGYAGIKAGSPRAKVAIGETSARGRDRRIPGVSDTHTPGTFARLVAKANKRLKFDAWAHHPYPSNPKTKPSQKMAWPNVSLTSLPKFNKSLRTWFKRKVPIWVTEYGHQTKPQDRFGVPYKTQAAYIKQSIGIARQYSFVQMFVWFVFRDDPGQPWESGLYTASGAAKGGSPAAFRSAARALDAPVVAARQIRRTTR